MDGYVLLFLVFGFCRRNYREREPYFRRKSMKLLTGDYLESHNYFCTSLNHLTCLKFECVSL